MGGRGTVSSSGNTYAPNPGGGGGEGTPEHVLGLTIPKTLKEALGAKKKPMSIDKAASGANPYYNPAYSAYSENCQRCVVAYELRRRGYDVTAQATWGGDELPYVKYIDGNGAKWGTWQRAFQHSKSESMGARTGKQVKSNIENAMLGFGAGSRAVVSVTSNKRLQGGHVFNVENRNGKIVYADAQIGKHYTNLDLSNVSKETVTLVRVDNLRISEKAREFVYTRK